MADQSSAPAVLVHCHMPKTAGSALNRSVLLPMHDRARVQLAYGVAHESGPLLDRTIAPDRISFLSGHIPYGFAASLGRPVLHVSVLRDPVDRMISFLNFVAVADRHGARKGFDVDMQGLARTDPVAFTGLILKRRRVMARQSNVMTRLAAGIPRLADTEPDQAALGTALRHLRSGSYLIGMQDDFARFAADLRADLLSRGIGAEDANPALATSGRLEKRFERVIRRDDLPDAMLRSIRALNDLDLRLCDAVREQTIRARHAA